MNKETFLYKILSGLMNYFGDMRLNPFATKIYASHTRHLLNLRLPPASILLTTTHYTFTRAFIPGELTHAALYIGNELIIEAGGHGIKLHSIYDTMMHADKVVVMVPRQNLTQDQIRQITDKAISYIDYPYDHYFRFKPGDKTLCCTELVKECFVRIIDMPLNSHGILTADDIYNNKDLIQFWDSDTVDKQDRRTALLKTLAAEDR